MAPPPSSPVEPIDLTTVEPLWSAPEGTGPLVSLGDVTGDGMVDVMVEAGAAGTSHVIAGPLDRPLTISNEHVAWAEGYGVGPVGDVTGDGVADVSVVESGSIDVFRFVAGPIAGDLVAAAAAGVLEGIMHPEFGPVWVPGRGAARRLTHRRQAMRSDGSFPREHSSIA